MRALPLVLLAALAPAAAAAQGRVIPRPCPVPVPCRPAPAMLERVENRVVVDLDERVLRYEVRETFVNRGGAVAEADYLFPLPAGAAFQELQLQVGDEMVSGEVLDAAEARRVYEDIVRRQRDPALVEWMGRGLLRARIFPIAPGETKRVVVRFAAVAAREGDALRVDYRAAGGMTGARVGGPTGGAAIASPEGGTSFTLRHAADARFGRAYSPTHALDVRESGGRREVRVRGDGGDVTLLVPIGRERAASIALLAHRPAADEDGFALVTVSPPAARAAATPRDVTFVVDVSGSMRGEKLRQAKEAGRQLLASLEPGDRFRVVAFASDVQPLARGWTAATPDAVRDAARWLDDLDAAGGTNIAGALEEALDVPAVRGRLPLVLFLTDGEPTVGERRAGAIAERAARLRDGARVFTFGVGHDVNAGLLEELALEGRGTAHFVRPAESVERAVSLVAARLAHPVVTDVRISADGVRLVQPHPHGALDIFAGQDLVLLARYRGAGPATVRVEGTTAAGPVRWTTRVTFPERARDHAYVARLWATQRVGWLSAERRRDGPSAELDGEIRALGLRYGIPTELSSYLVLEPGMVATGAVRLRGGAAGATDAAAPRFAAPPPAPAAGFEAARTAAARRAAVTMADVVAAGATAGDGATELRVAGGRTFRLLDEVWTDATWTDSLPVVRVRPFSDAWFRLVERIPELREPLALGDRVRVRGRAVAVEVTPEAAEVVDVGAVERGF